MHTHQIKVSPNFTKMAKKSILAIILFIAVYLILFVLALALTVSCTYLGIALITLHPAIYTLIAGFGLICIGFLILIFLVKFMFTSHKVDRSHLIEIYRHDQPQLFELIDEIAQQVHTDFPKRVYLSSDVNAAVFYDSNFWSMLFPIRKNLQIGIGLANSVTVTEFKAILAHEFGHFSQRTMKVGSYVYHVNQIIYNLLYENQKFENFAERLANMHGIVSLFVRLAMAIISGTQWLLKKVYSVLNLNYLALSREMEYHADEVAATVAGSAPLANALLR